MSGSQTPIERLADDVVSRDVAAQASVPRWQKGAPPAGLGPARTAQARVAGGGPNWRMLGLLLLVVVLGGGGAYALISGGQSPQPTAVAQPPTQSAPATATAASTATAGTTATATAGATATATAGATASATPGTDTLGQQPGVQDALDAISNGTIQIPATIPFFGDGLGTLYLPHDGSPATFDAPYIDTTGASLFGHDLSAAEAVALSAHACGSQGERDGVSFYTSCNQPGPLPAGEYLVFIATFGAGLPDPFPQTGQCVFSFQSDVDNNPDTGFQSQLPFNFLVGADVYYETLFFYNQANEFTHYVLATDHARPVRPDTGDVHGNLATAGRAWNLMSNGYAGHIVLVPAEHWGDNFSAGGFCDEDRTAPAPEDFAVDALGEPSDLDFPQQIEIALDIFFPPRP